MKTIVLVVALVGAAVTVATLRAALPSTHSCTADAQGVGYRFPTPAVPPEVLQAIQSGAIAQAAFPTVDVGTPDVSGTPPLGFQSWAAYAQWAETQLGRAKQGTAVFNLAPAPASVGGLTGLANPGKC